MKKELLCVLLVSIASLAMAQEETPQDSLRVIDSVYVSGGPDTVLLKSYATRYDPRKALLYAAVLPGMGQIYNKKYWKLPLVYGGFGALAYGVNFYQQGFLRYKRELFTNLELGLIKDGDIRTGDTFTTANYRRIVDLYKRQRDFMLILMAGMYLLQIVDAHVDAHLKEFDVNPELKVSLQPLMEHTAMLGNHSGFSLIIRF